MLLTRLHAFAAARGDGLRPELLALMEQRAAIESGSTVIDLAALRGGAFVQAGPNPLGPRDAADPARVVDLTRVVVEESGNRPRAANAER